MSVFWPGPTDEGPEQITGDGLVALPGSIVLDDAPGPEIFLAVFDLSPTEARRLVEHAWRSGGSSGVMDLAHRRDVDALTVERIR